MINLLFCRLYGVPCIHRDKPENDGLTTKIHQRALFCDANSLIAASAKKLLRSL